MSTYLTDRIGDTAEIIPLDNGSFALIHPKRSRATIILESMLLHILNSGGFLTHENGQEC